MDIPGLVKILAFTPSSASNYFLCFPGLSRFIQEKIQPLIVPAILEHEEIAGISGNKPISDLNKIIKDENEQKPTTALIQELTNHYKVKAITIVLRFTKFCF